MQAQPMQPSGGLDIREIMSRAIKYLVEGAAVAVAAYFIPRKKMNLQEIAMIALTAAAVFAILDLYAPAVGVASRQGAGFGIGASLVGFGGVPMGAGRLPGVPSMVM
jgi:ABC-type Co2+ transport system permease subunit